MGHSYWEQLIFWLKILRISLKRFYSVGDLKLIWSLETIKKILWTLLIKKYHCKDSLQTLFKYRAQKLLYLETKKNLGNNTATVAICRNYFWRNETLMSASHLAKDLFSFVSMKALEKWSKIIFILWFLFLRYLHFCPDFLVIRKNGLIRKFRLIWKFIIQYLKK